MKYENEIKKFCIEYFQRKGFKYIEWSGFSVDFKCNNPNILNHWKVVFNSDDLFDIILILNSGYEIINIHHLNDKTMVSLNLKIIRSEKINKLYV